MSDKAINTMDIKTLLKNNIRNYSMFIILFLIMIIFGFLTNWINWLPRNFVNIFFQNSYVLILAIGMVMVIITRNIDLSVGSVCAFVGALSAMIYNTGVGMPVTVLASILIGGAIGAFQGVWVAYAKLPAFIVTLSGMLLFRGLTFVITDIRPISLRDHGFSLIATGTLDEVLQTSRVGPYLPMSFIFAISILLIFYIIQFLGRKSKINNGFQVIPMPLFFIKLMMISFLALGLADRFARSRGLPIVVLVLCVAVFIFTFILKNTVLGRYIYAVGGNPRSAKLSGINSEFIIFIVFCFMGALAGLAAVIFTGFMNTAHPAAGQLFELDTIAACYIGGVSAGGGIGTVIGVVVGGLVMSAINNGMILMNLGSHLQQVVRALILLLAVFYDVYSRRKSGLG